MLISARSGGSRHGNNKSLKAKLCCCAKEEEEEEEMLIYIYLTIFNLFL